MGPKSDDRPPDKTDEREVCDTNTEGTLREACVRMGCRNHQRLGDSPGQCPSELPEGPSPPTP